MLEDPPIPGIPAVHSQLATNPVHSSWSKMVQVQGVYYSNARTFKRNKAHVVKGKSKHTTPLNLKPPTHHRLVTLHEIVWLVKVSCRLGILAMAWYVAYETGTAQTKCITLHKQVSVQSLLTWFLRYSKTSCTDIENITWFPGIQTS